MLFTTQFELNVTIKDMNAIYSTDYEQMLLDHAKIMHQGKCRDGQYVKSVNKIIKRSLPNLIVRDLETKVRVYVVVEASVIRYDQYDFITGMRITKIIPAGKIGAFDMVECKNDHVCALMRVQKDIDWFKVGDLIPIRVGESMYKIGNEHILVNGYPFLPYVPDATLYSLGGITEEVKNYHKTMIMPLIEREMRRKEAIDPKVWDKFSVLIHPFKTEEKPKKMIDIKDIGAIANDLFGVNYKVNMSEMKIYSSGTTDAAIVSSEPNIALTRIMFPFIKWMEAVNDLSEQYSTEEKYNAVQNIWKLYEANKF